jgi:enamine deaminase RidA (YjgF/YER057c/UK114 family)
LSDIVRTRILLTRIEDWEVVARVHGDLFRDVRPVNTVMQVSRFIDPDRLVEVEADAVVTDRLRIAD